MKGNLLWIVLFLCLVSFAASGLVAEFVFERLPHLEDEVAYLFQARVFALGRCYVDSPPKPSSFFAPFVVDYQGKRFGKYPPGYSLLLSTGVLLGQPWVINSLATALSLFVLYLLGAALYNRAVALLAVVLGLSSPFLLIMSGTLLSHPACLLFISLFLLFFFKATTSPRWYYPLAAGAWLGLAFLIRPVTALGVGAPFFIYALALALKNGKSRRWTRIQADCSNDFSRFVCTRTEEINRFHGKEMARYALMAVVFLFLALLLPWYNFVLTSDPLLSPYRLCYDYDRFGFGLGFGPDEHTLENAWYNLKLNLSRLNVHLFGWPLSSLLFVPVPFLTLSKKKWDYLLLAGALSLALTYTPYWASGGNYGGPRYYYEALPLLFLLTARGIEKAAYLLSKVPGTLEVPGTSTRETRFFGKNLVSGLVYLVVAGLVLYNLGQHLPGQLSQYRGFYGITAESLRAAQKADLKNALVFVYREDWTDYAPLFSVNSPTLDSEVVYAIDRGEVENADLMALYPDRAYYYLKGTILTRFDNVSFNVTFVNSKQYRTGYNYSSHK